MTVNLIDPLALQELTKTHLNNSYSIVDARSIEEYKQGHLPGAVLLDWQKWIKQTPSYAPSIMNQKGWWGEILSPSEYDYESELSIAGINSNSSIVVYADGVKSKGADGRVAWMLLFLGAQMVSILNGGFQSWLAIQGDLDREDKTRTPDCFKIALNENRIISTNKFDELLKSKHPFKIWDCRSVEEYSGTQPDYLARKGHISDAQLFEFHSIYRNENSQFIERDEYLDHIQEHNLESNMLVAYCEIGLRASSVALLHEAYTNQIVPVLDGGFFKWSSDHKRNVVS